MRDLIEENGPAVPPTEAEIDAKLQGLVNAKRYEWLEYHKWNLTSEWYFNLVDKLVLPPTPKLVFWDIMTRPWEHLRLNDLKLGAMVFPTKTAVS